MIELDTICNEDCLEERNKARDRPFGLPLYPVRNGYLPISPDSAGVCFKSDAQTLASESDMKPQPLRTFGNTISLLWFLV